MTVENLIKALSKFDMQSEVLITDGYAGLCYSGDYEIKQFENCVDIGIGSCEDNNDHILVEADR